MAEGSWAKAPGDLVRRFEATVGTIAGVTIRPMFGYPAGFVGGNLATSLHRSSWIVRLPEAEREDRLAHGWVTFEPMPGRTMREYVVLPDDVAADPSAARPWVETAAAYTATLPPKAPRGRARRR
jgi:TfoX/Sxy family transcriptional regulator of competence genes